MKTKKVNTVFQWKYLSLLIQLHPHRSEEHSYVLQALFQILLVLMNKVEVIHVSTVVLDTQLLFDEMV